MALRSRRALISLVAAFFFCLYALKTLFTPLKRTTKCTQRPAICGHRVIGDEAATLGYNPTEAMSALFKQDVRCFDGDVIRLADGTLYMAHPLMFKPYIEHITNETMDGYSTEALMERIQSLSEQDMLKAAPELHHDTVQPVKLQAVLKQYASLLSEYGYSSELDVDLKPPASPWLFLEPKRATYSNASLAHMWRMLEEEQLQSRVAIWAMDGAHYDILMAATRGHARVIWAYMDQEFSDQISTVPFPAPWPPSVEAVPPLEMFGIAKRANARWTTDVVQPAMVALWLIDGPDEFHAACMEGADLVITNRPLKLLAADI